MNERYPCCRHCGQHRPMPHGHLLPCGPCRQATDPSYVEEADANPERRNNGCLIYQVGDRG